MAKIEFPPEATIDLSIAPKQLEAIAHSLTTEQFLHILSNLKNSDPIPPLLVGLSPSSFYEALIQATETQFSILKLESLTEPLQHQILSLSHHCENLEEIDQTHILDVQNTIDQFSFEELKYEDVKKVRQAIEDLKTLSVDRLTVFDKALELTWNSNRLDLIEKLSLLRERLHRQIAHQIGHAELPQTGLYLDLTRKLESVYQTNEMGRLKDEEPVLDGLALLSIWYLKNYWEIGLLPKVKDLNELAFCVGKNDAEQRQEYHKQLLCEVKENLKKLGLITVGDLRKEQIYSKPMLKEYIKVHATSYLE